jgi:hypothetical protein
MKTNEHIEKMTGETLDSLDGSSKATPKPFLMTRIRARMEKQNDSIWETAGRFIAKPAVIIVGFCVIVALNIFVITDNGNSNSTNLATVTEQNGGQDEYATNVSSLYNLENNIEP